MSGSAKSSGSAPAPCNQENCCCDFVWNHCESEQTPSDAKLHIHWTIPAEWAHVPECALLTPPSLGGPDTTIVSGTEECCCIYSAGPNINQFQNENCINPAFGYEDSGVAGAKVTFNCVELTLTFTYYDQGGNVICEIASEGTLIECTGSTIKVTGTLEFTCHDCDEWCAGELTWELRQP